MRTWLEGQQVSPLSSSPHPCTPPPKSAASSNPPNFPSPTATPPPNPVSSHDDTPPPPASSARPLAAAGPVSRAPVLWGSRLILPLRKRLWPAF